MLPRGAIHAVATILAITSILTTPSWAADRGKAVYVGGTLLAVKEKTEAPIDLKGDESLVFRPKDAPPVHVNWSGIEESSTARR